MEEGVAQKSQPLRERLGWRTSVEEAVVAPGTPGAMATAGAWFAAAAALIAVLAVVLPHSPTLDEGGMAWVAAGAAALALVAVVGYDRLPLWVFHVGVLAASATATGAVEFWGDGADGTPLPYLWPTLYAFYFFSVRSALAHLAALGIMFAALLVARDPGYVPVAAWATTMGTLGTVGLLVAFARDRLNILIAKLSDAARRDPLTQLLNRRGFSEVFDVELERARRTEQGLSVVVGDLDGFKQINDRFGHAAGDEALHRVGQAILRGKRSWDSAARVGGEEFAVLAPDTDEHGAYIVAERLRTAVEDEFEDADVGPLTASFGIVSFPVHAQTAEGLLQAGDQALYAAKRLGRNRSVISSAEVPGILARTSRAGRDEPQVELGTLLTLAEALDVRDSGSSTHCRRVGRYAELIARELGLPPDAVERVRLAGILHDVGRVGMPDELVEKTGPLSEREWELVRSHPEIGARMLDTTDYAEIGQWILAHHERPDGAGYPAGRKSGEVPIEGAILGAADAYEAMTAERPYRAQLEPEAASEEMRREAGRQFDERVVDALLRVV